MIAVFKTRLNGANRKKNFHYMLQCIKTIKQIKPPELQKLTQQRALALYR